MSDARARLLRENNPDFASFVLGGTHIRDVPTPGSLYPDRVIVSLPWVRRPINRLIPGSGGGRRRSLFDRCRS